MSKKCSVIDILMKPRIAQIPLLVIISLLSMGIYIGGRTYENSEEYLDKYINHRTFIFFYTIMIILLYVLFNYMFGIRTMIGYYLKFNLKPLIKICKI